MPTYNVGSADMDVAKTAYATAKSLGASAKVLLALFEAGFVESGFRNLNHGDRDSLGFLQQRPSQGWKNPTDVKTATTSFVEKAQRLEGKYSSAAQLAQAVQVSAYPERYGQASSAATSLLKKMNGGITLPPDPLGPAVEAVKGIGKGAVTSDLVEGVQDVAGALKDIASTAAKGGRFAEQILKLALPTNLTRLIVGVMGVVFVFIGIYTLTREARK